MIERFLPGGYLLLAQAVLRTATAGEPETWVVDFTPVESAIYAGLGREYEPFELRAAFMKDAEVFPWTFDLGLKVDEQRLRAMRRATSGRAEAAKRFQLYEEAEKRLRRALYQGKLPFVLQHARTGLLVHDATRLIWGERNAPNWFNNGQVIVPNGATRRIEDGLGSALEVPDGEIHNILIPEDGLNSFLAKREPCNSDEPAAAMPRAVTTSPENGGEPANVNGTAAPPEAGTDPASRQRQTVLSHAAPGQSPRPKRGSPERDLARDALRAIYGANIPEQKAVTNAALFRRVGDWLKANEHRDLKNDTILRAAGRRK